MFRQVQIERERFRYRIIERDLCTERKREIERGEAREKKTNIMRAGKVKMK